MSEARTVSRSVTPRHRQALRAYPGGELSVFFWKGNDLGRPGMANAGVSTREPGPSPSGVAVCPKTAALVPPPSEAPRPGQPSGSLILECDQNNNT